MKTLFCSVAAVLAVILAFAGTARADLSVVASIPPVHSLVAKVMAGVGTPHLLLRNGQSPHDYALRPSDARAVENADLVFLVSHDIENFLAASHQVEGGGAKRFVELGEAEGVTHLPVREAVVWKLDRGHAKGAHSHDEHAHGHDGDDPHVWLSPRNAMAFTAAIATVLAERDPANGALYRANAIAARQGLEALSKTIAARLDPVKDRPFLVFHDAYQYFEAEFGLMAAGAISLGTGAPPGAGRLTELRELVSARGIKCIFREVQFSPRLAEIVAEGTGARLGLLDPVGSSLDFGPDNYDALMLGLAEGFRSCLE
ncbi:zinc ABC transporter substrate-binding protein [Nisaea sediminum]|uniref:zinc ABC transporter substrate-binding protein n=1 Tax=Nisaea sediminum TaxID=2775867 RepID=UPI0018687561|nr:zinc ABC transporter substrate-binding protein [Nisaea sediminum]